MPRARLSLLGRCPSVLALALTVALGFAGTPRALCAQADTVRTPGIVTGGDVGALAIFAGLATLAYTVDEPARDRVRGAGPQRSQMLRVVADVGDGYGGFAALTIGAAMWGGGLITRRETVAIVGLRAVEAITVSGIVTRVVKGSVGRARPRVPPHERHDVEFGRGFEGGGDGDYESFPSGHATAAFAFAAAVSSEVATRAPQHARAVTITTYGLGVITAYARMHDDAHWLSDVTMGTGIGLVSGWAVTRWHRTRPDNRIDRWLLRPIVERASDGSARLGVVIFPR